MRTVLVVWCALLGLVIGSFLNVVIYRVPRGESILRPGSHCPRCGSALGARDNVPVVSWIALRGRCRYCETAISPRYLAVEVLTAVLFASAGLRLGFSAALPAALAAIAVLVALSVIDLERLILPKKVVYAGLIAEIILLVFASVHDHAWSRLGVAGACAVAWFTFFFLINLVAPRALGFGDVRLSLLLGVFLGWFGWRYAVVGFFLANLVGAVVGLGLIVTRRMDRSQPVPYGLFLAAGAVGTFLAGPVFVSWATGIR
ncbi:MAG: prepilin peptidase [Acidimicrobiales bacterium]